MAYSRFVRSFLLLMIYFEPTTDSLLSRFRNPNEYVARDSSELILPEDIDDTLYEELLVEVPELRGKLRWRENGADDRRVSLPYLRNTKNANEEIVPDAQEFDREENDDREEYPSQLDYMTVTAGSGTRRLPFLTGRPAAGPPEYPGETNLTAEALFFDWFYRPRKKIISCYWCGLNYPNKLPNTTLCYDAFESPDWRARTMARFFRARCYWDNNFSETVEKFKYSKWTTYLWDRGLVRIKYGPFHGGCFKRFLDVGKIYTQRGCRTWWPRYSNTPNFVTHRYTRMEALLSQTKDYCLVSPHASLTPFSRAVSLYVRYHVCVCSTRYCNGGARPHE